MMWRPTVDWRGVLPVGLAVRQLAWERRATVRRMRTAGLTYRQIADRLGVSRQMARFIATKPVGPVSPVESYAAASAVEVDVVGDGPARSRKRQAARFLRDLQFTWWEWGD